MTIPAHVEVLDTTLREGEQCYGVFFPIEVKKRIALLLDRIGVDFIEAGHPAAAPSLKQAVAELAALGLATPLVAHARLDRDEIGLVRDLGIPWVSLFSGINGYCQRKYGLTRQALYRKIEGAVSFARARGLRVKFGCEDASRTALPDLIEFYSFLLSLPVDRLSFADTLGVMVPQDVGELCSRLSEHVPLNRLHFHFHDDGGRARENAAAALAHGGCCIDASVMGIGERTGLVPLEWVRGVLSRNGARVPAAEAVAEVVDLVARNIDHDRYQLRRHAHKSGIHIDGMIKDPVNYEAAPGQTGRTIFVLSKLIGRAGLRMLLSRHGFRSDDEDVRLLLRKVKADEQLELADPDEVRRYLEAHGAAAQFRACAALR